MKHISRRAFLTVAASTASAGLLSYADAYNPQGIAVRIRANYLQTRSPEELGRGPNDKKHTPQQLNEIAQSTTVKHAWWNAGIGASTGLLLSMAVLLVLPFRQKPNHITCHNNIK